MKEDSKQTIAQEGELQINMFKQIEIRKVFHKGEWWFSLNDVIVALTDTVDSKAYINKLKARDEGLKQGWGQIVHPLSFLTSGGPQELNAINVEGIFRLLQSVPSKKVEPFKRWLAKTGYERIQEFQNPELTIKRAILAYKLKGYDDEWIKARIGTISSRRELTDEWQKRGVNSKEYGLLTDAISIKTFGLKTKDHKKVKGLQPNHQLRDNMTPVELALTMLGETSTVKIAQKMDAKGFWANKSAAEDGGSIAGDARLALEKRLGESVVSRENYLSNKQKEKALKKFNSAQLLEGKITNERPLKINGGFEDVMEQITQTPNP